MSNRPRKSTTDPPGKVTRHFFLQRIDIPATMPVEFTNYHLPTLVKFQSGGLKRRCVPEGYSRWTHQRTNKINLNSTRTQSNCLFVTINLELWLQTSDIDIEFLVIPRMKNGAQSEGLVCVLNGRLRGGGRPGWLPQRNSSDVEARS